MIYVIVCIRQFKIVLVISVESSVSLGKEPRYWKYPEAQALVRQRLEMESQFRGAKSHSVLWNRIVKQLNTIGIICTLEQCVNRFKQLKRQWRVVVDHNSQTGNDAKTATFQDQFNEVYGTRATTIPAHAISSMNVLRKRPVEVNIDAPPRKRPAEATITAPPRKRPAEITIEVSLRKRPAEAPNEDPPRKRPAEITIEAPPSKCGRRG